MLGYSRYRASFVLRFLYGPPSFLVIFSRFFNLSTLNTYIFQFLGAGQVAHKEAYLEQLQPMPKYLWTKWTVREQRHLSTCVTSMDGEFMIVDMTKMRVLSATRVSLSKQSTFFFPMQSLEKEIKDYQWIVFFIVGWFCYATYNFTKVWRLWLWLVTT